MKVTVKFFPLLSTIIKTDVLEVKLPKNATLKDLLHELLNRFGRGFLEALYISDVGATNPYTSVIVDGKPVLLTETSDLKLNDGSVVVFLSPVGGG